ncbi:alpha/beta hydrolase fold-3 [Cordyceps fumosorosea ARSEF 2679]|uniref:Alpha/beta hydrolase fold-3 n=1 Tax=Cordyceps fumosorosea (strain ARSEF 2679) TaxID=1081104 RepID=A0A167T265_CORFA|nr:alpha/beta hydrolase fold-3 [Cordyceps fumosorosea ARSEF 2679]OAA60171.1 alpha/beta hydrolase fold-3 [Cordyceps fumosorosea ARSEF 2679]
MAGKIGSPPPTPPASPDPAPFDIYPVHMLDNHKSARNIMMQWIFRVDAQLDADKVRAALALVLETGDWCKLAGRLHYTKAGTLEIRVPHTFTDQEPPFTYTHRDRTAEAFDDDELRRALPSGLPRIYPQTAEANAAIFTTDTPRTLQEHIKRGLPQLALAVTTFRDATLLELAWPHTVMDATGQRELLAAWSLALAGRAGEVRPLAGAGEDVARRVAGEECAEDGPPDVRRGRELVGLGKVLFFGRYLWRLATSGRADWRIFHLPRAVIRRWRDGGVAELPRDPDTGRAPFVSDGDLLCAWLVTLVAAGRSPQTRYVVAGSVNYRGRVPALRDGVYVQNLLGLYFASIPAATVVSGSDDAAAAVVVARIALAHRREVALQTSEAQVLHQLRRRRADADAGRDQGAVPVYCAPDEVVVMCNNLSGLRIGAAADFGPAVVPVPGGTGSGRVVSHHYLSSDDGNRPTPYFVCLDQDKDGYWIRGNAAPETWEEIGRVIGA